MNTACEQISFITDEQKQDVRRNTLRLRERLLTEHGFEAFDDAEILTTVLSYAKGARDIVGLVNRLFDAFGSLKAILEARPEQLLSIEGMTLSRASMISLVVPLTRVWHRCAMTMPERIGNAYTQEAVANLYDQKYRIANSGKLETNGKYHYLVPDPFALFEALFLGLKPVGSLRAGEVYVKGIEGGRKVDVLRSPHMHTSEHAIEIVAKYRKAFEFLNTKAVYINVHDLLFRRLQCDFDGDIALVDDNPVLIDTAERSNEGLVPLYYDAQKGKKKPLNTDAIIEPIFNASDYNRIGIYSIYAVKLLASDNPDMTILAKLAAAGNFAIDAVKTGGFIELPKDIEKALRKLDKPAWWKYDHQNLDHPYTDSEYWDAELSQPGNGVIDHIGKIIRNSVPAKVELNVPADNTLWAKMCINPCRKTVIGVVEAFRDCARRNAQEWNAIFRKRPDLRENWEEAAVLSERKILAARQEIIGAAKGDIEGAYDTICRALFKYPQEASFKRFFWSVFGDMAAEVISNNLLNANESVA